MPTKGSGGHCNWSFLLLRMICSNSTWPQYSIVAARRTRRTGPTSASIFLRYFRAFPSLLCVVLPITGYHNVRIQHNQDKVSCRHSIIQAGQIVLPMRVQENGWNLSAPTGNETIPKDFFGTSHGIGYPFNGHGEIHQDECNGKWQTNFFQEQQEFFIGGKDLSQPLNLPIHQESHHTQKGYRHENSNFPRLLGTVMIELSESQGHFDPRRARQGRYGNQGDPHDAIARVEHGHG
mmetsp:Transcript_16838/g.34783  ORF Transcript_16838/g.34783 Transcript_16838/m.34783 type:complete len:235 (+) Transcript_16838:2133-2837(+)